MLAEFNFMTDIEKVDILLDLNYYIPNYLPNYLNNKTDCYSKSFYS
jgi:hypothetical protein